MTRVETFIRQLESNGARVWQTSEAALGESIHSALAALLTNSESETSRLPTLASFLDLDLSSAGITLEKQVPDGNTIAGLSRAALGICETGTLALIASPVNPTSLNFVVDYHLVIVDEQTLVNNLAEAMTTLTEANAWNARGVNFVSGPSRTADIEQTIQLGAHGPRHLLVFLVNRDKTA